MIITQVKPQEDYKLFIYSDDGRMGVFDVFPYLDSEAFKELKNKDNFKKVNNNKYFIEWECGADLSADTIECNWELTHSSHRGRWERGRLI